MKILIVILFSFFVYTSCSAQASHTLDCLTYGTPSSTAFNEVGYYMDGNPQEYNGCGINPSIMIAIIDSCSCSPLDNCNLEVGQVNIFLSPDCTLQNSTYYYCRGRPTYVFQFDLTDSASYNGMIQFINSRSSCEYILAYTWFTYPYSTLSSAFKNTFISLGATAINTLPDDAPYIFFCKKGNLGSVIEVVGANQNDTLALHTNFNCATINVDEVSNLQLVDVYPNPTSARFRITNLPEEATLNVQVIDFLGTIIHSERIYGIQEYTFESNFAKGVYFVRISTKKREVFRKLVIE